MKICIIRHGATEGNLEKRYVGTTDESLLRESAVTLKRSRRQYPVPQYVVTSPLKRCMETAAALFPGVPSGQERELRECDFGRFEYKNYQELTGDEEYQRWIDSNGTLPFPGGESQAEFADRCCAAFIKSVREQQEKGMDTVAYVVHGGTIMAVMERFCKTRKSYFDWQVKNGCGFELELDEECDPEALLEAASPYSLHERERKKEDAGTDRQEFRFLKLVRELPFPESELPVSGIEEHFVVQQNKRLQCGYTTGSCATAAAKAAVQMIFEQELCRGMRLMTPAGVSLLLETEFPKLEQNAASCAVRKYGGDDPDATDGLLIFARAELLDAADKQTVSEKTEDTQGTKKNNTADEGREAEVLIDGGKGVGRVTKPGLDQPVGAAAINHVPRQMITQGVKEICAQHGYSGRVQVNISAQGGEETAQHTFNPLLGIVGGISILGTSGIVEPMSEKALVASLRIEMQQKVAGGEQYLLMTPGNYGADFVKGDARYEALRPEHAMMCSNYIGETLDIAADLGVKGILFVSHIGKFIKMSGGIKNTHSAHADCRAELMAAQAMRAGVDYETAMRLLATNTTEEAMDILVESGKLKETIEETIRRIRFHLDKHTRGALDTEVILYSSKYGYLGETAGTEALIRKIAEEKQKLFGTK